MIITFSLISLQGALYGQEPLLDYHSPLNGQDTMQVMPDLDGDGFPDFLFANPFLGGATYPSFGEVRIVSSQTGAQLFQMRGASAYEKLGVGSLALDDLDADGLPDILIARGNTNVTAYSSVTGLPLSQLQDPWGPGRHSNAATLILADDLDSDGFRDYYYGAPNAIGTDGAMAAASSATGNIIWTRLGTPDYDFGRAMDTIADIDGDGIRDLLSCSSYTLECLSGASGVPIWSHSIGTATNPVITAVDDLNGDGIEDLVYGHRYSNDVFVHSGQNGSLIRAIPDYPGDLRFGCGLLRVGDLDSDGAGDFLVGSPESYFHGYVGKVYLFSGGTGARLATLLPPENVHYFGWDEDLGSVGDWDGDGIQDFSSFTWIRVGDGHLLRIHRLVPPLQLTVTGSCPGNLTINVTGGSPFRAYGIAIGNGGVYVPADGPLEELELNTGVPVYRTMRRFDALGADSFSVISPSGACGLTMQVVEMATRSTSATVTL